MPPKSKTKWVPSESLNRPKSRATKAQGKTSALVPGKIFLSPGLKHSSPCVNTTVRDESVQPDKSDSSDRDEGGDSEHEKVPEFQEPDDVEQPSKLHKIDVVEKLTSLL